MCHPRAPQVRRDSGLAADALVHSNPKPQTLITPESKKGSPKVNFSSRQWVSKVQSANIGAFEGIYPFKHSGVETVNPLKTTPQPSYTLLQTPPKT